MKKLTDREKSKSIQEISIGEKSSMKEAIKKLETSGAEVLLVLDNKRKLTGTLTEEAIRNHFLAGNSLEDDITGVYNKNPQYIKEEDFSYEQAKKILTKNGTSLLPVLDREARVIHFITLQKTRLPVLNIPVIIMAGGRGTRLQPFTLIMPKPLLPIGDKPVLEIIIDQFRKHGPSDFYLTLKYKAEMIMSYFDNIEKDYKVEYIVEKDFLGTAGSLKLLEYFIDSTFIVSNSDIVVKADYGKVVDFHRKNNALLTIVSAVQYYKIPYGVISYREGGELTGISEKPEYMFMVNTGVYILEKEVLRYIPEKTNFNMSTLIDILIKDNKRVFTYPVWESCFRDVGQFQEYKKTVDSFKRMGLKAG